MSLVQLETFVHAAEHGSFSKAALVLGVAQPALSLQVAALKPSCASCCCAMAVA